MTVDTLWKEVISCSHIWGLLVSKTYHPCYAEQLTSFTSFASPFYMLIVAKRIFSQSKRASQIGVKGP